MLEWTWVRSVDEGGIMEDTQVCRMDGMGVVIRMMRCQRGR